MPEELWPWMHLVGRILFAIVFVGGGMSQLFKLNDMAAYAQSKGVPAPKLATVVSGVMIIVGGMMVLLGWRRFIGAGLLVLFLVPTALVMHAFWKETDPTMKRMEMSNFMKNIALAGAALFFAYYAGIDWPMTVIGH